MPKIGDVYLHERSGKHYLITFICKHGKKGSNLPDVAVYHEHPINGLTYYRNVLDFHPSTDYGYTYVNNIFDLD